MKKIVYIVLIAIMALVIILTAVLLIINLKGKDSGTDASPSTSVSASPSGTPQTAEPAASASPSSSPSPSPLPSPTDEGLVIREEAPDGVTYTITPPDTNVTYRLTVDEAVLPYAGSQDGQMFRSPNPANENYLKITFVPDATAFSLAPSFLNAYIAFTEFEQSGTEMIGGTKIAGEKIAANDGTTQVEAWLVDTKDGVLAVVISYAQSEKDAQLKQLDDVLATLEIKGEDAEGWAAVTAP